MDDTISLAGTGNMTHTAVACKFSLVFLVPAPGICRPANNYGEVRELQIVALTPLVLGFHMLLLHFLATLKFRSLILPTTQV